MASLSDLPTEAIILILQYLGEMDLQTLMTSQSVSKQFSGVIQHIISRNQYHYAGDNGYYSAAVVNPLWDRQFKGLLRSADCFTPQERLHMRFLTIEGDMTLPYRRMPWAHSELSRAPFLRPGASWLGLSLTFGSAPITRLDIIKTYSGQLYDVEDFYQVELPATGLTMGMLYDLLLSEEASYQGETGSWELLVGRHLKSFDTLNEYGCFIADDIDLVESGPGASQSAIMFVRGGCGCEDPDVDIAPGAWIPAAINTPPKCHPWHGPKLKLFHSHYM